LTGLTAPATFVLVLHMSAVNLADNLNSWRDLHYVLKQLRVGLDALNESYVGRSRA
jgi:hypothetical protein